MSDIDIDDLDIDSGLDDSTDLDSESDKLLDFVQDHKDGPNEIDKSNSKLIDKEILEQASTLNDGKGNKITSFLDSLDKNEDNLSDGPNIPSQDDTDYEGQFTQYNIEDIDTNLSPESESIFGIDYQTTTIGFMDKIFIQPNGVFDVNSENLEKMKVGITPTGLDGKPVEIHHCGQNPDGPFVETTKSNHCGPGNYSVHHHAGESDVEHGSEWDKLKKQYWRARYASITRGDL